MALQSQISLERSACKAVYTGSIPVVALAAARTNPLSAFLRREGLRRRWQGIPFHRRESFRADVRGLGRTVAEEHAGVRPRGRGQSRHGGVCRCGEVEGL